MANPGITLACWPRLMDVHLAAIYLSVGESTIRDYVAGGILRSVEMPGSTLRDRAGNIVAPAKNRKLAKIMLDKMDLDKFIEERKAAS